ncbi:MAG: amino acid permease [Desulfovibrio sp.]|nr:amino acid permease [Desulfovibrio sp.]
MDSKKNVTADTMRSVSRLDAWALSLGCILGWGSFVMPGTTFLPTAGPAGTAIAISLGALVVLVIAVNFSVMLAHHHDDGGAFSYARHILGHDYAFLCAWALGLAYVALIWANATAFALIGRYLLGTTFQWGWHYSISGFDVYLGEVCLALIVLVFFAMLSLYADYAVPKLQTILVLLLLICIGVIFVIALSKAGTDPLLPAFARGRSHSMQIFGIVALVPWAFVGFESIAHSASGFQFPTKRNWSVMLAAIATGALVYIMLTCLAACSVPDGYGNWQEYIADLNNLTGIAGLPTFYAAQAALGKTGLILLTVAVLATLSTSMLGFFRATSRLSSAMAKEQLLPAWFAKRAPNGAPRNAILFIMAISLPIPFLGRTAIGWLTDVTTVSVSIAYCITSACCWVMARRMNNHFLLCTGFLGMTVSGVSFLFPLIPNLYSLGALSTESYLVLALWSISGFIFFRLMVRRDQENRLGKSTSIWIMMIFLIFFSAAMWMKQTTDQKTTAVIAAIDTFHEQELQQLGIKHDDDLHVREDAFLEQKMDEIRGLLLRNSAVLLLLIVISLATMFSILSSMLRREKSLSIQKAHAEERNRAKTVFLFNMSHDIRTPMNAIIGYTGLALKLQDVSDVMRSYLEKIDSSSHHLLALINDVLEMSRIESGKMELEPVPTNLVTMMDEMRNMFSAQMEAKGIIYSVDTSGISNTQVLCDHPRFNRVLLNLISNAYKFTPEKGQITVTLLQTGGDGEKRACYELHVKDSGIGMDSAFAKKIFEPFERERTSTVSGIQGTGLGMAITKSIIDLMDGSIEVITAPGQGTEFIVRFCLETQKLVPDSPDTFVADTPKETTQTGFHGKRVLLVEDMAVNRELANLILTDLGFAVDMAEDGRQAVDKVAQSAPGYFDIILMDIQMPNMNGYEASQAIRAMAEAKKSHIPIVAMTANAFTEDVQAAHEAGMNGHIAKPLDIPVMTTTLKKVLGMGA